MLCKQNPARRCTGNFAPKYWVGDRLLAKCEGEIQVRQPKPRQAPYRNRAQRAAKGTRAQHPLMPGRAGTLTPRPCA